MLIAFGFVGRFGFIAVCFANPLAWILADVLLIPMYFIMIRKLERTVRAE